jgi:alpha-beta hydrolase superfamily lysophospholipase
MEPLRIGNLAAWHHLPSGSGGLPARVLLVHGIGEHSERHRNTIDYLVGRGVEVVRFDLRGSGQSEGARQWIECFEDYVDDVMEITRHIEGRLPPRPLFLMGHSLGGAIVIHTAAEHGRHFQGLILSAPAYLLGSGVSPLKVAVGRVLARFAPRMKIPGSLDLSAISRDPKVIEAYRNDPYCYTYNTLRQGDEILKALDRIPELVRRIKLPTLLLHGTADRIIRPEGSQKIYEWLASDKKHLEIVPGGYHELYNDLDKDRFFSALGQFLGG